MHVGEFPSTHCGVNEGEFCRLHGATLGATDAPRLTLAERIPLGGLGHVLTFHLMHACTSHAWSPAWTQLSAGVCRPNAEFTLGVLSGRPPLSGAWDAVAWMAKIPSRLMPYGSRTSARLRFMAPFSNRRDMRLGGADRCSNKLPPGFDCAHGADSSAADQVSHNARHDAQNGRRRDGVRAE